MHGGVIYMRGKVDTTYLGKEVGQSPLDAEDEWALRRYVTEFAQASAWTSSACCRGRSSSWPR